MSQAPPFRNKAVEKVFENYPDPIRKKMMALRQLIFDTAAQTEGVGALSEELKWGEPAYLTPVTRSGSTIRIDWKLRDPDHVAMFFICNTNLISTFKAIYPDELTFMGNRGIVFGLHEAIPTEAVSHCISLALTYHLR